MKKCPVCLEEKNLSEYSKSSFTKSGFRSQCKSCESNRYFKNKSKIKSWQKKYYERNKEKIRARNKKFYQNNIERMREESKSRQWEHHLKYAYGITEKQYDEMVKKVDGKCEICGMKPKKLRVDHCHKKGHVRGLLCDSCNYHLPIIEDKNKHERALVYLRRSSS